MIPLWSDSAGRWYPSGAAYARTIEVGKLIPHRHKVYRVTEVRPVPRTEWDDKDFEMAAAYRPGSQAAGGPVYLTLRPVEVRDDDPQARSKDLHVEWKPWNTLYVYRDEHYDVCAHCHEPQPCRELLAIQAAAAGIQKMERYETPGVCPACSEVITRRQAARTYEVNLEIPGGPPVTFHVGRANCRYYADQYARRLEGIDSTQLGLGIEL